MSMEKRVAVISASPKTDGSSVSGYLGSRARNFLGSDSLEIRCFSVRESITKKRAAEVYEYMAGADALVIIFPLYVFCMPGILTRFLQDYHNYAGSRPDGVKELPSMPWSTADFRNRNQRRGGTRHQSFSEKSAPISASAC